MVEKDPEREKELDEAAKKFERTLGDGKGGKS